MCVSLDHLDSPLDLLSIESAGHLDELGALKSICQNRRVENIQTIQLWKNVARWCKSGRNLGMVSHSMLTVKTVFELSAVSR